MSANSEKVIAHIESLGFVIRDREIHRTHAGRLQRNLGAWSWWLDTSTEDYPLCQVGSQFSLSQIAKAIPNITVGNAKHNTQQYNIDPA